MYVHMYMLRTNLKPSARFKTVWPGLKPSGWIVSGPGPFYNRPVPVQTALKLSSPVEGRVVIHAATVQLRPVRALERQRTCNSKQRTAPAQCPVACPARPRTCKYVRAFPPCAPLLHPVVTLPVLPAFQSSKRTSACRIVPPSTRSRAPPPPWACLWVLPSAPRCSSVQVVSGPSGHRYLPFHCRYSPASVKSAQTRPRRSAVLACFTAVLARFSAIWPGSKPSGPF